MQKRSSASTPALEQPIAESFPTQGAAQTAPNAPPPSAQDDDADVERWLQRARASASAPRTALLGETDFLQPIELPSDWRVLKRATGPTPADGEPPAQRLRSGALVSDDEDASSTAGLAGAQAGDGVIMVEGDTRIVCDRCGHEMDLRKSIAFACGSCIITFVDRVCRQMVATAVYPVDATSGRVTIGVVSTLPSSDWNGADAVLEFDPKTGVYYLDGVASSAYGNGDMGLNRMLVAASGALTIKPPPAAPVQPTTGSHASDLPLFPDYQMGEGFADEASVPELSDTETGAEDSPSERAERALARAWSNQFGLSMCDALEIAALVRLALTASTWEQCLLASGVCVRRLLAAAHCPVDLWTAQLRDLIWGGLQEAWRSRVTFCTDPPKSAPTDDAPDVVFARILEAWAVDGAGSPSWPAWVRAGVRALHRFAVLVPILAAGVAVVPSVFRDWTLATRDAFPTITEIVEGVRDLMRRLREAYLAGSLAPLFATDISEPVTALAAAASMAATSPIEIEPRGTTQAIWLQKEEKVSAMMRALKRQFGHPKYGSQAQRLYQALATLHASVRARACALGSRAPPEGFLFYSKPQVGKNELMRATHVAYHVARVGSADVDSMYHVNVTDEYHDSYDAFCHKTAVIDELFPIAPAKMSGDAAAKMVASILTWVNSTTKPLQAARIEEKNMHYASVELVLATTNVKDFNARHYGTAGGAALLRRFDHVITVEPRDEFASPEGALNTDVLAKQALMGMPVSPWTITVEKTLVSDVTADTCTVTYKQVYKGEVDGFLRWVAERSRARSTRAEGFKLFADALAGRARAAIEPTSGVVTPGAPGALWIFAALVGAYVGSTALLAAVALFLVWRARSHASRQAVEALVVSMALSAAQAMGPWAVSTAEDVGAAMARGAINETVSRLPGAPTVGWFGLRVTRAAALLKWENLQVKAVAGALAFSMAVGAWVAWRRRQPSIAAPVTPTMFVPVPDAVKESIPPLAEFVRADPAGWEVNYRTTISRALGEVGIKPDPMVTRPAYAAPTRLTLAPLPPATRSMDFDAFVRRVEAATYPITVHRAYTDARGGSDSYPATAVKMKGTAFLTAGHVFTPPRDRPCTFAVVIHGREAAEASLSLSRHELDSETLVLGGDGDAELAVFHVPFAPGRSDLTSLLPTKQAQAAEAKGHKVCVWNYSTTTTRERVITVVRGYERLFHNTQAPEWKAPVVLIAGERPPGSSGGPAVVEMGDYRLLVLPLSGNFGDPEARESAYRAVTREQVEALIARIPRVAKLGVSFQLDLSAGPHAASVVADAPHPKSWVNDVRPCLPVPGVYEGRWLKRVSPQFRIERTPLEPRLEPLLDKYGAWFGAPVARGVPVDVAGGLDWMTPQRAAFDGVKAGMTPPASVVDWCIEDYLSPFPRAKKASRPATIEEAIFGSIELGFAGMDLSRSAGPALGGLKGDHAKIMPDGTLWVAPALKSAVDERLAQVTRDGDQAPIWTNFVSKEESLKLKKLQTAATRQFNLCDFADLVVVRMFIQPVVVYFDNVALIARECAIGVNALDPVDAERIYTHSTRFGEEAMFDLDGPKFDKGVPAWGVEANALVWAGLAERAGYDRFARNALVRCLLLLGCMVHVIDGLVFLLFQIEASGMIATAHRNSTLMALYVRLAFLVCAIRRFGQPPPVGVFRQLVSNQDFGDDMWGSVRDIARDWFNFRTAHAALAQWNVPVTSGAKGDPALEPPFRHARELEFLKRKFWRDSKGLVRAALSKPSILKSLTTAVRRGTIAPGARDAQAVENALRESAMWGREFYDELRDSLGNFPLEEEGYACCPRIPEYERIIADFEGRSLRTWDSGGQLEGGPPREGAIEPTSGPVRDTSEVAPDGGETSGAASRHGATQFDPQGDSPAVSLPLPPALLREAAHFDPTTSMLQLASIPLPLNSYVGTAVDVFSVWCQIPAVVRKLANNKFLQGTMHLRLEIQSNLGTYGLVSAFVFDPLSYRGLGAYASTADVHCVQLRSIELDLRTNPSAELLIPSSNPAGVYDLEGASGDTYAGPGSTPWLYVVTRKVPRSATGGAAAPTLLIRACVKDLVLAAPTAKYMVTPTSGPVSRFERGVASKALDALADGLKVMSANTSLAGWATPAEIVARTGARVAQLLGFSRPADLDVRGVMVATAPSYTFSQGIGALPSVVMATDPKAGVPVGSSDQTGDVTDDLSVEGLGARWGVAWGRSATSTEWLATAAAGTRIGCVPVCPSIADPGATGGGAAVLPPVGFAAAHATYWTGSLEFRIRIVASSLHGGRLRVRYLPSVASANAAMDPGGFQSLILDAREATVTTFVVGWQQARPVALVPRALADVTVPGYTATAAPAGWSPYTNGWLSIEVEQQLTVASGTPVDAGILIDVRAGEDFALYAPSEEFVRSVNFTSGVATPYEGGGGGRPTRVARVEATSGDSLMEPRAATRVQLAPGIGTSSRAGFCSGERMYSLRPMLRALRRAMWIAPTANEGGSNFIVANPRVMFSYRDIPAMFWANVGALAPTPDTLNGTFGASEPLVVRMRRAFNAERGSHRMAIVPDARHACIGASEIQEEVFVSAVYDPWRAPLDGTAGRPLSIARGAVAATGAVGDSEICAYASSSAYTSMVGSTVMAGPGTRASQVEGVFDLPYHSCYQHEPTGGQPSWGAASTTGRRVNVGISTLSNGLAPGLGTAVNPFRSRGVTIFWGVGDDHTLFGWAGSPIMT